jgi:hypothetical protein
VKGSRMRVARAALANHYTLLAPEAAASLASVLSHPLVLAAWHHLQSPLAWMFTGFGGAVPRITSNMPSSQPMNLLQCKSSVIC